MGNNYYDDMKSLLTITRKLDKQQLKEDLSKEITPEEYAQEIDKFKKGVTPSVEFSQDYRSFKIYEGYVEWNGVLLQERISFTFTTENSDGIYISGNQVQLTDTCFQTIAKLTGYYKTWVEYWGTQLTNGDKTPAVAPQAPAQPNQGGENGQN